MWTEASEDRVLGKSLCQCCVHALFAALLQKSEILLQRIDADSFQGRGVQD